MHLGRGRSPWAPLATVLFVVLLAAGAATWSSLTSGVTGPIFNAGTELSILDALACPTAEVCIAVSALSPVGIDITYTMEVRGVFRTSDGGRSWRRVAGAAGAPQLSSISCPTVSNCVGMSEGGIVYTEDGGRSWSRSAVNDEQVGRWITSVSCPSLSVCIAVGSYGTASSDDGGRTWVATANSTSPRAPMACPSVARCVAAEATSNGLAAAYTIDGGRSWTTSRTADLPNFLSLSCSTDLHCVAVGDAGARYGPAAAVTTDGGVTWSTRRLPDLAGNCPGLACSRDPLPWALGVSCAADSLFCAAVGGLGWRPADAAYSTDGGLTWRAASVPGHASMLTSVSCQSVTPTCTAIGLDANGGPVAVLSTDGGARWATASIRTS